LGLLAVLPCGVVAVSARAAEPPFRRTVAVDGTRQLTDALAAAAPGDDIVLAAGTYDGDFSLQQSGLPTAPIRVRAAAAHRARLTGRLLLAGDHAIAQQLEWRGTPTEGDSIVEVIGQHCRVTRCRFVDVGVWNGAQRGIVRLGAPGHSRADHAEISYNYFKDFAQRGVCVNEHDPGSRHAHIFRNHFDTNILGDGKDGIAIGIGGGSGGYADMLRELHAIVEYNLLEEIGGGMGNSLQAKCSSNIFRFNTVKNTSSRMARIEIRSGRNCQVIGNAVLGTGGPVVLGDDHLVIGNYNDGAKNGNWTDMGPMAGLSHLDDVESMTAGRQAAARNCLFAGNVGILRLGSGTWDWPEPARGTIIEGHQGEIVEQHAVDTIYREPTRAVPRYVVLGPAEVGPDAA
jgi:hypothetical protein